MGDVIPMSRPPRTPAMHDTSMSDMRERMRRADVEDALRRLLDDAARPYPRLSLRLTRDVHGMLAVVAAIDGGTPRLLGQTYPESRLDDFAGVVRTALPRWTRTLAMRLSMRLAS